MYSGSTTREGHQQETHTNSSDSGTFNPLSISNQVEVHRPVNSITDGRHTTREGHQHETCTKSSDSGPFDPLSIINPIGDKVPISSGVNSRTTSHNGHKQDTHTSSSGSGPYNHLSIFNQSEDQGPVEFSASRPTSVIPPSTQTLHPGQSSDNSTLEISRCALSVPPSSQPVSSAHPHHQPPLYASHPPSNLPLLTSSACSSPSPSPPSPTPDYSDRADVLNGSELSTPCTHVYAGLHRAVEREQGKVASQGTQTCLPRPNDYPITPYGDTGTGQNPSARSDNRPPSPATGYFRGSEVRTTRTRECIRPHVVGEQRRVTPQETQRRLPNCSRPNRRGRSNIGWRKNKRVTYFDDFFPRQLPLNYAHNNEDAAGIYCSLDGIDVATTAHRNLDNDAWAPFANRLPTFFNKSGNISGIPGYFGNRHFKNDPEKAECPGRETSHHSNKGRCCVLSLFISALVLAFFVMLAVVLSLGGWRYAEFQVVGSVRLLGWVFSKNLLNRGSVEYNQAQSDFCNAMNSTLNGRSLACNVTNFSNGSVIVHFNGAFRSKSRASSAVQDDLMAWMITSIDFQEFDVDAESIVLEVTALAGDEQCELGESCGVYADCVSTKNGHVCTCRVGYAWDGEEESCTGLDEGPDEELSTATTLGTGPIATTSTTVSTESITPTEATNSVAESTTATTFTIDSTGTTKKGAASTATKESTAEPGAATTAATEPESTAVTTAATEPESTAVTTATTEPESTAVTTAATEPESTAVTTAAPEPESTAATTAITETRSERTIFTTTLGSEQNSVVTMDETTPGFGECDQLRQDFDNADADEFCQGKRLREKEKLFRPQCGESCLRWYIRCYGYPDDPELKSGAVMDCPPGTCFEKSGNGEQGPCVGTEP